MIDAYEQRATSRALSSLRAAPKVVDRPNDPIRPACDCLGSRIAAQPHGFCKIIESLSGEGLGEGRVLSPAVH